MRATPNPRHSRATEKRSCREAPHLSPQAPHLARIGWTPDLVEGIQTDGLVTLRISAVERNRAGGHDGTTSHPLIFPPDLDSGDLAVGDWVLVDRDSGRIDRVLPRRSLLRRRAAGPESRAQLIAANVDRLFIVTSCNADFNPARLERYIALALEAGAEPFVLLTKADQCDDAEEYVARARALSPELRDVIALNAKSEAEIARLRPHIGMGPEGAGLTVALIGSSGVGKSTLINALTGGGVATAEIREDDAKGRHTTTARAMHLLEGGGVVIDMPGMRELGMIDSAGGIDILFNDIAERAAQCRFRDCAHAGEPGCAVREAVEAGEIDAERVERWLKLRSEDAENTAGAAEKRARGRATTRHQKAMQQAARRRKGN